MCPTSTSYCFCNKCSHSVSIITQITEKYYYQKHDSLTCECDRWVRLSDFKTKTHLTHQSLITPLKLLLVSNVWVMIVVDCKNCKRVGQNLRRALSITGFALNSPPKWGSGGDFVGRGKDIWWESTSVLIFPSASVCSDLKALYKSVYYYYYYYPPKYTDQSR